MGTLDNHIPRNIHHFIHEDITLLCFATTMHRVLTEIKIYKFLICKSNLPPLEWKILKAVHVKRVLSVVSDGFVFQMIVIERNSSDLLDSLY